MIDVKDAIVALALCMLVTACGRIGFDEVSLGLDGDGGAGIDAGTINNPDAFTGCGEGCVTGMARVTVLNDLDAGMPDVPVVVSFPDGTLSVVTVTDATGSVDVEVIANSMVTVPLVSGIIAAVADDNVFLYTVAGVQIGDDLVLSALEDNPGSTTITVGFDSAMASATSYVVSAGCNSAGTSDPVTQIALNVSSDCDGGQILGLAMDMDQLPLAWAAMPSTAASPATLPAWNTSISDVKLNIDGPIPEGATATVQPMYNEVAYSISPEQELSGASASFRLPSTFGERWQTRVLSDLPDPSSFSTTAFMRVDDSLPAVVSVDFASDFLAKPTGLAVTTPIPSRPAMSWSGTASNASSDLGLGIISWQLGEAGVGQWIIAFPPSSGSSLITPELPESMAQSRPPAEAELIAFLYHVDVSFIDGYDAVRSNPVLQSLFEGRIPFTEPASGPYEFKVSLATTGFFFGP